MSPEALLLQQLHIGQTGRATLSRRPKCRLCSHFNRKAARMAARMLGVMKRTCSSDTTEPNGRPEADEAQQKRVRKVGLHRLTRAMVRSLTADPPKRSKTQTLQHAEPHEGHSAQVKEIFRFMKTRLTRVFNGRAGPCGALELLRSFLYSSAKFSLCLKRLFFCWRLHAWFRPSSDVSAGAMLSPHSEWFTLLHAPAGSSSLVT